MRQFDFEVRALGGMVGGLPLSIAQLWHPIQSSHLHRNQSSVQPGTIAESKAGRGTHVVTCVKSAAVIKPAAIINFDLLFAVGCVWSICAGIRYLNRGGCCEPVEIFIDQQGPYAANIQSSCQKHNGQHHAAEDSVCFISILCRSKKGFDRELMVRILELLIARLATRTMYLLGDFRGIP